MSARNTKVRKPPSRLPGLGAKRSLGQNFLVDRAVVEKIVEAFAPDADDLVLEIGPGHGALTERLIDSVEGLFALEFDRALAQRLRNRFSDRDNFQLIEDDALSVDFRRLSPEGRKLRLIANLPYNISTAILQRLFDCHGVFADCVLMFQREVVERITAQPGTKERGYLTVLTEAHFTVEHLFDVPPDAFQPVPKVWSAVARLTPHRDVPADQAAFRKLVSEGFAHKRKTILNNLKVTHPNAEDVLRSIGIDPRRRAETLTLDEWRRLLDTIPIFEAVDP